MRIKILLAVFLIGMFCFAPDSPAEISNRVVAMVDKDVITLYELNNRILTLSGKTSEELKEEEGENFAEVRQQIIDAMINEKIAQVKIQELSLQATEEQVDASIEYDKQQRKWTQEDLLAQLKERGITYEAYRKSKKEDIETDRLINREVQQRAVIVEAELEKYYREHQDEFRVEERVDIACIFLMIKDQENKDEIAELTKKGEGILARLKKGEDFGALAKEFSEGSTAEDGGRMGEMNPSQFDSEIKKVVDGLKEGEMSGLINRAGIIQIIKLLKREGGNVRPYAEVRDAIYTTLQNEEMSERYSEWIKGLREKTYIKINF